MKKLVFIPLLVSFLSADGVFSIGHKNFSFNIGQDNIYGNEFIPLLEYLLTTFWLITFSNGYYIYWLAWEDWIPWLIKIKGLNLIPLLTHYYIWFPFLFPKRVSHY